jgi:hypothetical protein
MSTLTRRRSTAPISFSIAPRCSSPRLPAVTAGKPVHGLTGNPVTAGHIGDRRAVVEDFQHGQIALLDHVQLHQHDSGLLRICVEDHVAV